jgi:hypothetical protein
LRAHGGELTIKNDTYFSDLAVGRAQRHSSCKQPGAPAKCCGQGLDFEIRHAAARSTVNQLIL